MIELPESTIELGRSQVESGRFPDLAAYITQLMELDHSRFQSERLAELIREGIESGEPVLADEAFWEQRLSQLPKTH